MTDMDASELESSARADAERQQLESETSEGPEGVLSQEALLRRAESIFLDEQEKGVRGFP